MNKLITSLLSFLFVFCSIIAQNINVQVSTPRKCGSPKVNLAYEEAFQNMLQKHQQFSNGKKTSIVYTIPVIFHVLHSGVAVGSGRNLSQAQINSQLTTLNSDYRKLNTDFSTYVTQPSFSSVAADVEINFCAAKVDPNGNVLAEPGIERINVSTKGWNALPYAMNYIESTVKPGSSWDPTKYYNVWILEFGGADVGTLGYAQFPTIPSGTSPVTDMVGQGGSAGTDGVVIDYHYIGSVGNVSAPYNKGRTLTHETGHWLGLWHIWGDDGTSCSGTDYVTDTPNQAGENYTCPTVAGSVKTDACAGPTGAMYQNYMDYSDDKCMVMFTAGQKARMQAVMANCVRRKTLPASTVCNITGIEELATEINFDVFPNPSNGEFTVSVDLLTQQDFVITVINTLGQTIKELNQIQSNGGSFKINLTNTSQGIYFVTIKSKLGSKTKRMILQ